MTAVWILWDANPDEAWDNIHRGIYATREAALREAMKRFLPSRGPLTWTPVAGRPGLEQASNELFDVAGFLERYEVKE